MFHFDGEKVHVTIMGPRFDELVQTLQLYVADTNKKAAELRQQERSPGKAFRAEQEKRRRTEQMSKDLFEDDAGAPSG